MKFRILKISLLVIFVFTFFPGRSECMSVCSEPSIEIQQRSEVFLHDDPVGNEIMDRTSGNEEFDQTLIIILLVGLVFFVTSVFFYFNSILRRKTNLKLMEKNEEIKKKSELLEEARVEAEKAIASKSMFIASLSHEIRTPLSSIIGISGLLEETELSEEQKEYLNVILISGNNLLSLINNILDFSKIEAGQIELEKVDFSIKQAIEEVMLLLRVKAEDSQNRMVMDYDSGIPETLIGDVVRLKQIIINLVNNALKFTKNGTVEIKAQLFDEDESSLRVKFSIIDDGIGVAIDQRDKLFKSFSQADSSIARKYGGTGLGLAICKHFANMMGGEIGVKSQKGKGSEFWFTVILNKMDDHKELELKSEEKNRNEKEQYTMPEKSLNVLLVEDNLLNQKFAEAILKKNKHKVDIARNGKIGVDLYKQINYDLVLMDIQMPVMDGITATKLIRQSEKEENRDPVKIIAVTAYALEGDEKKFFDAGIDDIIRKPYKAKQLINKLKYL